MRNLLIQDKSQVASALYRDCFQELNNAVETISYMAFVDKQMLACVKDTQEQLQPFKMKVDESLQLTDEVYRRYDPHNRMATPHLLAVLLHGQLLVSHA